jgi:uncharacterized membrane protein
MYSFRRFGVSPLKPAPQDTPRLWLGARFSQDYRVKKSCARVVQSSGTNHVVCLRSVTRLTGCDDARSKSGSWCHSRTVTATVLTLAIMHSVLPGVASASIGEALGSTLRDVAPDWAVVMCLAATPLIELRGAIPVGIVVLGMHPLIVLLLAVLGNMLPVPLIVWGLGPLSKSLDHVPALKNGLDSILHRAQRQVDSWDAGNVFWALAIFVGIPLPGTGAWSGAIVAFVLGLPFWYGVAANGVGVLIAGTLVTALSCMGWAGFWTAVMMLLMLPLVTFMCSSMQNDAKSTRA